MQTHRDYFVIDLDLSVLKERISEFRGQKLSEKEIAEKIDLGIGCKKPVKKERGLIKQG